MRVMVFVKATADSENGVMPKPEMLEAMGRFNQDLVDAGILDLRECGGLKPTSNAKRVAFDGAGRTVEDGPFDEPGLVAGWWIWTVRDMDEAVQWVKRCPNPMPGPSTIEIRPFYEMSDFQ
jgi:hypothetical protein